MPLDEQKQRLELQLAELRGEFRAFASAAQDSLERLIGKTEASVEVLTRNTASIEEHVRRSAAAEGRLDELETRVKENDAFRNRVLGALLVVGSTTALGIIAAVLRFLLLARPVG
jgi:hypothetical protein